MKRCHVGLFFGWHVMLKRVAIIITSNTDQLCDESREAAVIKQSFILVCVDVTRLSAFHRRAWPGWKWPGSWMLVAT